MSIVPNMERLWGKDSKEMHDHLVLIENMQIALERKQIYYSEIIVPEITQETMCESINPVTAKIIVLIDRFCFSSCLIFINELQAVSSSITLFGEQTGKNSEYMDVRDVILSDDIYLIIPMAIERNPQGIRTQFYVPNIAYPANVIDIQGWLESCIKKMDNV